MISIPPHNRMNRFSRNTNAYLQHYVTRTYNLLFSDTLQPKIVKGKAQAQLDLGTLRDDTKK